MFNVYMLITVYLVNLLRLTFKTPKKSSLLSPPLCSSNVRVCFHTMRSVSSQKQIFEIFAFHTFQTPAFSSPAFTTPAVWCRVFQSRVFQSRVFSRPIPRSRPGDRNASAHHWLNRRRVSILAAQGRLYTQIRSLHRLGGRVLTGGDPHEGVKC